MESKLNSKILNLLNVIILIFCLILSCILVSISQKNDNTNVQNKPGLYAGVIIMIFLFFLLMLFIVGGKYYNYFRQFYFWIVGGLFFLIAIFLLVGFLKKDQENFLNASGTCMKDGKMGFVINGKCQIDLLEENQSLEDKLERCQKAEKKLKEKCVKDGKESFGDLDYVGVSRSKQTAKIGICEYQKDGVVRFGYSHPYFGKKCVDSSRIEKMLKEHPEYGKLHKIRFGPSGKFEVNPFQSTQCFGFPKTDLLNYDLKCKEKFGNNYGLKSLDQTGCPENDNRGLCEIDYQMGEKMDPNSTKCVPIGTDMNNVCQRKNLREKKTKYVRTGYKTVRFGGCPEGTQRAICDGNYFSGKELFPKSTECFPEAFDPDRKCKEKFGLLSFADRIISENCLPGNIRAICKN